jgi:hypothetical protein
VFETIAQALWQQTLLLGLATAATMPLRALTLRFLGAHSAYLLWLGVPAACVGGWLPGPALWTGSAPLPGANLWAPLTPAAWGEAAAGSHNDITSPWLLTLLVVWLAGAALLAWCHRPRRRLCNVARWPSRLPAWRRPALGLC